jgi:diaminobutyrate-2-oxoglutarate transaminase
MRAATLQTNVNFVQDEIRRFFKNNTLQQLTRNNDMNIFESLESNVRTYCRDFPAVFTEAVGSVIRDSNGHSYTDFFSGAGALNYGHNNPKLQTPLLEYLRSNGVTHSLDFFTLAKRDFIQTFQDKLLEPRQLQYKFQFTGPTGTNAVEAAMKLARKVTGRTNIIAFSNAFHGMSLGALSATSNPQKRIGAGLPLGGVTFMPYDGYFGATVDAFEVMARMLAKGGGIDVPAAFLFETIQGEGGLRTASASWTQRLQDLARSLGSLVIVDDIQAGCGRSGTFFSFEGLGISPDIVCLSKSLSGYGIPMSLNLIKPEHDLWNPGEHNGTFRGNNLAFVTAKAAIEEYWQDDSFKSELSDKIDALDLRLEELQQRVLAGLGKEVRIPGRGFMRGIDLGCGDLASRVSALAFRDGLIVETCGVHGQVVKLLPALTIELSRLQDGMSILEAAIITALRDTEPSAEIITGREIGSESL